MLNQVEIPEAGSAAEPERPRPRVLFFVEGFTDIRFVRGLAGICDLCLTVPEQTFGESGLKARIADEKLSMQVHEISGGRLAFQLRSLYFLLRHARQFDLILSQEVLRGSLNATSVGRLYGIPVLAYLGISPLKYFACRRERGQIGPLKDMLGRNMIRFFMWYNGKMAKRWLAMGPYLCQVGQQYCRAVSNGLYYGVDTQTFKPASREERTEIRRRLDLSTDRFLVILSSRISHEKDPETALRAVAHVRKQGLDAVLLNLGGGFRQFLELARTLDLPKHEEWVWGRPAVNPIHELPDYFRGADAVALASLAEGAAYSTLEALSCGTPVAATRVGGMALQLEGYARLSPRQDAEAMARDLLWIYKNPEEARTQALQGREYVVREWDSRLAFEELAKIILTEVQQVPSA